MANYHLVDQQVANWPDFAEGSVGLSGTESLCWEWLRTSVAVAAVQIEMISRDAPFFADR